MFVCFIEIQSTSKTLELKNSVTVSFNQITLQNYVVSVSAYNGRPNSLLSWLYMQVEY